MVSESNQRERILEDRLKRLNEIGLALSAEKDVGKLLELILKEARAFATADAGTVYLIEEDGRHLRFAIQQNDTVPTRLAADGKAPQLPPVPLYVDNRPNHANVSSHVALSGQTVNIADVYESGEFDFTGPRRYDASSGYRSKSMLVIPIKNYEEKVVGVVQLLNAKDARSGDILPFTADQVAQVESLASVASVALTNAQLNQELSDELSRVKDLQHTEKNLNQKLSTAYLDLEKSSDKLKQAMKRARTVRRFIVFFVLLCALGGGGILAWNRFFFEAQFASNAETADDSDEAGAGEGHIVRARPVSANISLSGKLAPLRAVTVVSPFSDKVAEKYFEYGEKVARGDLLVRMDTAALVVQIRGAKSALINVRQRYTELVNWAGSTDVSRSKRSLSKIEAGIESAQAKLKETLRLYERGIIPRSEFESAQETIENLSYALKSAREELAAVEEKGCAANVEIARLELENAREKLNDLQNQLGRATISAPVSGVVIMPQANKNKFIAKGIELAQGEMVVSIGNLDGFTVKTKVDEVDVPKIKLGQTVTVTGDAFADMNLAGHVTQISSQANTREYGEASFFDVTVAIESFTAKQKAHLKLGMSSSLQVKVYDNPKALLIPIYMVQTDDTGSWVRVRKAGDGEIVKVPVETGMTTLDAVEIVAGLKEGDEVVM